jgi:hypothetical protein
MKSITSVLMPAHHTLQEVIAAQLAHEAPDYAGEQIVPPKLPDPIFALQGQPQLVAIAQVDRNLALTLKRLLNQLEEGEFGEAASTSDELSHRIRTNYLASLSDGSGVATR